MRELERRFSPEFRNRIDEVVMFAPLTKDEVREIALQQIDKIEADARRRRQDAAASTPRRSSSSCSDGYSLAYGARFLKRVIDERIKLPISQRWTRGHGVRRRRASTARSRSSVEPASQRRASGARRNAP